MAELEEVVATLLEDPVTEPIASEIGGASGLSFLFDEESSGKVLQSIYGNDASNKSLETSLAICQKT